MTCHVKAFAELGVMGVNIPERWGGPGVGPTGMLLALVEISHACAATSSMIGAHYLGTDAVLIGGDGIQRNTWLPRAASGEWLAGFCPDRAAWRLQTSLGPAQAALDAAAQRACERRVGGEPLAKRQGIQWMLAGMSLRLEAFWALTLQATALGAAGRNFTLQSTMAKLHASEMVGFVTDAALQIHGGYGFTRDMPLERYVRDARILRIYEGSSEIQRTIIARAVLG